MTNDEKVLLEKIFRELQDIKVILQENTEFNDLYVKQLKEKKLSKNNLLHI